MLQRKVATVFCRFKVGKNNCSLFDSYQINIHLNCSSLRQMMAGLFQIHGAVRKSIAFQLELCLDLKSLTNPLTRH